ncbi:monooxygenase [Agrocybe pediades]|nr:monooxygenase [Agrocybe pediades]
MSSSNDPQILIVGSGPSGLILALSLLRNGVPVRVIEKSTTNRIGQRGAGLMPRTFEAFESLGILDQVVRRAATIKPFCVYKMPEGVEVLREFNQAPYVEPTPAQPYLNQMVLGQDNLDKIIRAELEKLGCTVELGVELLSFKQDEGSVQVKLGKYHLESPNSPVKIEETSYKWLVGADGARSTVRKQLGVPFPGETSADQRIIKGDIMVQGLSDDKWHMWGEPDSGLTVVRSTETPGLFNFILGSPKLLQDLNSINEVLESEEKVKELLKLATGNRENIAWGNIICANLYTVNVRMADTFKKGRVFLTGDAGHIHSPAGGQGLNSGVQDSFNLGWKLALVIKGLAGESLLETYSEERIPVIAEMLNLTKGLFKKTVANVTNEEGWKRNGAVDQLGVNYRWSSVVVDEESERLGLDRAAGSAYSVDPDEPLRAGDRAPDAPGLVVAKPAVKAGETTRLFHFFHPAKHTIIIFLEKADLGASLRALAPYSKGLLTDVIIIVKEDDNSIASSVVDEVGLDHVIVLVDREGLAHAAYDCPQQRTGVFVVRPDRIVGARVSGAEGIQRYFNGILGDNQGNANV